MTRTVLVILMAALLCLALTGLRVAVLQRLSAPEPLVSPRGSEEPQPPGGEPPIEYIAAVPAPRTVLQAGPRAGPALSWAGALRGAHARAPRAE